MYFSCYNYSYQNVEMIIMAQIQKQKVKLTDLLRDNIKKLRKENSKRGDILSKELDRGASYVSQLENGKIKDIEFNLLDNMFRHIVSLSGDYYNDYMQKYICDIIGNAPSKEFLYNEEWIHIFVMQNFQVDISDTLIEIISKKLDQVNYTPEQLVKKINQNEFQRQWSDIKREPNKLYVSISGNYDDYSIYTDITYSLPEDYISNILSKEITTASYIFMYGILKNLYTIEKDDKAGAIERTEKILFDNKFFDTIEIFENLHNLSHSQQPLNIDSSDSTDMFTFYDDIVVNYNEKYKKLKKEALEKLEYAFDRYRSENTSYACETMGKIIANMDDDLGLIVAILSAPLNTLPRDMKHYFHEDYRKLIERYSPKKK